MASTMTCCCVIVIDDKYSLHNLCSSLSVVVSGCVTWGRNYCLCLLLLWDGILLLSSLLVCLYHLALTSFSCFLFLVENVDMILKQDPKSDSQVSAIQPDPNVRCKPAAMYIRWNAPDWILFICFPPSILLWTDIALWNVGGLVINQFWSFTD